MKAIQRLLILLPLLAILGFLVACDGGSSSGGGCDGGSSSSSSSSSSSGGVVLDLEGRVYEKGYSLNSTVYLRDSAQKTLSTQAGADGAFRFNGTQVTPPFILWTTLTPNDPVVYPWLSETTFYSTCGNSGTVNISSLTHLVLAMAVGRNPTDLYAQNPGAAAPSQAKVDAAQGTIHDLLALVYADLGISTDVDLMTVDIGDAVTGYRRILDMVRGATGPYYVQLYARPYHRPYFFQDFINDNLPAESVGPEAAWLQIMGMQAAAEYVALLNSALADGAISSQEQSAIVARWAPDYLNRGVGADQVAQAFAAKDLERLNIHRVLEIQFIRPMFGTEDHPLGALNGVSEKGPHEMGFWGFALCQDRDLYFEKQFSFILHEGQWLLYGDRSPFNSRHTIQPAGLRTGPEDFLTGLKVAIDDVDQAGFNRGIYKVAVFNSALPTIPNPVGQGTASAMVLEPHFFGPSDPMFRVTIPSGAMEIGTRVFYLMEDGLDISKMYHDSDYYFYYVALDQSNTPRYAWMVFMEIFPYNMTDLQSNAEYLFPRITSAGSADPLNQMPYADAMGPLAIAWQNPAEPDDLMQTIGARIEWVNAANQTFFLVGQHEIQNPALNNNTAAYGDWRSATFNPPPAAWQAQWAAIEVSAVSPAGELFMEVIEFQVLPPHTP